MHKQLCFFILLVFFGVAFLPLASGENFIGTATPDELYSYIQELYSRKFDETLLPQTEHFLRQYPDHAYADTVRQIRIAILNRLGQHRETAEAIDEYLRLNPNSSQREAFLRLAGACRFHLKDYEKAAVCYRLLADGKGNSSDREEAMLALASCQQFLKNPAEERKLLEALVELPLEDGHDARRDARLRYAPMLQNDGDYQAALKIYLELVDSPVTPAKLRPPLLYNAATLAFQLGEDLALPERLYTTLLVENPSSELSINALRQLCFCKFRLRKYEEFLALAEKYRQQAPASPPDQQLVMDTVEALMALKRYEQALPFLKKVINGEDTSPEVLKRAKYYEVLALLETAQDEQALLCGNAYLDEYPNTLYKTYLLARMADCALRLKDFGRARAFLEQLLPLVAGTPEAVAQYGLQLARLYENDQLWLPAFELLEKLAADTAEGPARHKLLLEAAQNASQIPDFSRARRMLDQVRNANSEPSSPEYQAASEMLYQFANQANQPEIAFQTAREACEKSSGRDRTVWLTRLGNHFLAIHQLENASECYGQALDIPELPPASRDQLLPVQVQLLLGLQKSEPLFALVPELFRKNLPLKADVGEQLANFCQSHSRVDLAKVAWRGVLAASDADDGRKTRATLRLAELEAATGEANEAKARLQELVNECQRRELPAPADAYALLAEISLGNQEYDLALLNVDRALEKDRPAVFTTRTATRAWYVKALFLYERQHDLENAKATASLAGLLKTDDEYSPKALLLIARILREQGKEKLAEQEESRIREKFPDFHQ